MLVVDASEERRAELDAILSDEVSGLVAALLEEGLDIKVARLRERKSKATTIEEKARLQIQITEAMAEGRDG